METPAERPTRSTARTRASALVLAILATTTAGAVDDAVSPGKVGAARHPHVTAGGHSGDGALDAGGVARHGAGALERYLVWHQSAARGGLRVALVPGMDLQPSVGVP